MEVKAWTYRKGWKAPQCAGVIHTDFEKGFIRAEVIKYEDYIKYGSEAPCAKPESWAWKARNTCAGRRHHALPLQRIKITGRGYVEMNDKLYVLGRANDVAIKNFDILNHKAEFGISRQFNNHPFYS